MPTGKKRKACYQCGEAGHRARDCPEASAELRDALKLPPVDRGHFAAASSACLTTGFFTFVELFAGMGGFRVALDRMGGRCVFASEIDRFCVENYRLNFDGDRPAGDVCRIESEMIPDHDILVGGFPCQPFSSSGSLRGMDDPKGVLFREIVRILKEKKPRGFILENVRGLLLHNGGATFDIVRKELEGCGYRVCHDLVDAVNLLPQERRRLFIVGVRDGIETSCSYLFPKLPALHRGVKDILHTRSGADALSNDELEKLALSNRQISKVRAQPYTLKHPEARFLSDVTVAAKTLQSSYSKWQIGTQFVYFDANARNTDASASIDNGDDNDLQHWRRYSSREAARLQGFPESFRLCSQRGYHMIGNSVSPPVISMVSAPLLQVLGLAKGKDDHWGWEVTKDLLLEAVPNDERKEILRMLLSSNSI
jgi:DNA (cytosine-5)-methyltransferase 1